MDKILDLDKSVASLVKEYPEVADIMADLGFTEIKNPAMLASVGRIMNLKKGSQMKKIPMEQIVRAFREKGFEITDCGKPFPAESADSAEAAKIAKAADSAEEAKIAKATDSAEATKAPEDRAEALRSLLDRLSEGEDLESVRADFVRDFKDVDPAEIMKAEQGLMESGMPLSKVQKLCDVHSALFHGDTREEKIANAERAVQASLKNQAGKEEKNYINKSLEADALIQIPGHPLATFTKENQALGKYLESTKARWESLVESLSGKVGGKNKAEKVEKSEEVKCAQGSEGIQGAPDWEALLSAFSEELAKLRSFTVHYAKKGDLLYPLLKVKYDISGPSQVMWTVDDEIRDTLGELKRELSEKSNGVRALKNTGEDLDDEEEEYSRSKAEIAESILNSFFLKNYLAVRNRMEEMIYKEENILFPMCALQFQKEEWIQIYFDSKDYEACFSVENETWKEAEENGNTPEKWRAVEAAGESEREKSGKEASEEHFGDFHNAALPQEAGKMLEDLLRRVESLEGKSGNREESPSASDGEIIMPGGHLKKNELIAMLNTLPVEITFVDKDNINRFFNEGTKVFKRPQMAIDREVFSCHPPKVEPMVRMIIGNFRDGKEDEVPIWMEKGGKPFLVRYMAVRDKEQNYVGTLEAVTDMTEVKEHFRQYFKSHPEEL
ncbi:hypothetical protein HMPREF9624_00532 [Oribacterium asaccharolyticum ACB7]|uniref:DUF438 domain-containing protein n=1 Tax=Oribacterium asaccharolyticum ACB7 TaxID=796944 RepID=G9WU22_9FIRM|nr:DUF438 domain-containing protein [Oribacterium asaccharolyticum]EHL12225.1 hypothetical protein HMPREF9624_00532 [Oribacterium asaccharolyticum ACB7]